MNANRFRVALRAFTQHRPFRPFVIELNSGTRLVVQHPEAIQLREVTVRVSDDEEATEWIAYFVSPGSSFRNHLFDHDSVNLLYDHPEEPPPAR